MKIAIFQPRLSYYVGGAETVAAEQARFLSLLGADVTMVTTRAPFIKNSEYFDEFQNSSGVEIEYIEVPREMGCIYKRRPGIDWRRWDEESLHISRLANIFFAQKKYDIVVAHNFLDQLSFPLQQRAVTHLHGYPRRIDYIHELADALKMNYISDSEYIKEKWLDILPSEDIREARVITNGVDSGKFFPKKNARKKYDILYIGRLIPIKGVDYLIKAVSKLKKYNLRVAIAGQGQSLSGLQKLAKKENLEENVEFLGYIDNDKLAELYNQSSIAIFPSYDREGIMTTMLEAAACQLPVITTTACSMKEFLNDSVNGLLVKPKHIDDLSEAIRSLKTDKALRNRLSIQARKDIAEKWDWKIKITKLYKEYERICSSG